MAETISGLYKAEVIWRQRSLPSASAVEVATLRWVDWLNNHRLFGPIGTSHPPRPKPTAMQPLRPSIWSHDTNENASGKAGAVQTLKADNQMPFYATTKKANEAMAHASAHIRGRTITMFRFYTIFGSWKRLNMALFKSTETIPAGQAIEVYNHSQIWWDFTYVGKLVPMIRLLMYAVAGQAIERNDLSAFVPWRVVNIGSASKVPLNDFINAIEGNTRQLAINNYMDVQPISMRATCVHANLLRALTSYGPQIGLTDDVAPFIDWYKGHHDG